MNARKFFLTVLFTMFLTVPLLVSVVQAAPGTISSDYPRSEPTPSRTPTMITPTPCPIVPNAVKLLAPQNGAFSTRSRVTLSWSKSTCASHYFVYVSKPRTFGFVDQAKVWMMHYTTVALTPSQTYNWYVAACDAKGCSRSATYSFYVGRSQ